MNAKESLSKVVTCLKKEEKARITPMTPLKTSLLIEDIKDDLQSVLLERDELRSQVEEMGSFLSSPGR
jgi:hypothetical protein